MKTEHAIVITEMWGKFKRIKWKKKRSYWREVRNNQSTSATQFETTNALIDIILSTFTLTDNKRHADTLPCRSIGQSVRLLHL